MKKVGYTLLFLLFASCCVHAAGPDTFVGVYYYPWYTDSKFHAGTNPTGSTTVGYHLKPTQVLPELGWYDQDNASVISQHYNWARYAGIDFFVCSYWGSGTSTDNCIRNRMFTNPDIGNIKLCVFLEPSITPAQGAPGETEAGIMTQTYYLCDNYFNKSCYFYIDGKPVIFIYLTRTMIDADLTLCINAIRTAAGNRGYNVYIAGDEVWKSPGGGSGPRVSQMDAVTNYDVYGNNSSTPFVTDSVLNTWQSRNTAWKSLADTYGTDFIPAISPGYNDRTVRLESNHPACSRKLNNESTEFGTLFTGMIDRLGPTVEMVMINSWNEWHEDTQIEPTTVAAPTNVDDSVTGNTYTQGVYYEGYGMRYLDILRGQFVSVEIPIGASARGQNPPNETADKAFDGNVGTKWLDFSPTGSWIQYRYADGQTKTVTKYAITSANDAPARDPKNWNLLGSKNGGITWDILDSRTGIIFLNRFETKIFFVSNPGEYNSYRLQITAVRDAATANSVQLAEIQLLACFGLADFDCDGKVDISDFSYLAGVWLKNDPVADIAAPADGQVNVPDLLVLVQEWLSDSLIDSVAAYWKLDETAGSVASDYSVNAHHGTLMNMDNSDWVAGKLGNALDFDGVNDYVEITGYKGVTGTASRTCCAWIKTTGSTSNMVILDWGAAVSGQQWLLGIFSTGKLAIYAGSPYIQTNALVTDGQWHHIAAVMTDDGSPSINEIKLYIDGVFQSVSYSGTTAINTVSGPNVMLGAYEYNGQKSSFFPGLIDDVRIYDWALSAAEIAKVSQ